MVVRLGGSSGAFAPSAPPMTLILSFQEKDSYAYLLDIVMDGTMRADGSIIPMDTDFQQRVSARVLSLDKNGVATVRTTAKTLSATVNAEPIPPHALPVCRATFRIAADGRVLGSSGLPPGSFPSGASPIPAFDQLTPLLPNEPVAVGDTWSNSYEQPWPLGDGSLRMDSASRLVGHQQVHGIHTTVIETTWTMPLNISIDLEKVARAAGETGLGFPTDGDPKLFYRGELRFNETSWFDASEGRLVSSNGGGNFAVSIRPVDLPAQAGFHGRYIKMNAHMTVNAQLLS